MIILLFNCYISPNFQNCALCEKDLKDNKDNSLHLGRKYVRIFVLEHYLFLVVHSFPRVSLSEKCSLLGTDNVRGQISEHIFAPNDGYCLSCVYISPNFQNCVRWVNDFKDNKHDSLHLGRKYARVFVLEHYFFLEAYSFPQATLSENCSLLGTDNVHGQIS